MSNMYKYTHLTTKIRAMMGKMLTEEDFKNILNMQSVTEIAQYLKNSTYYRQHFEDIRESDIHRGQLEVLLYRALLTDALKIARYLKGNEKAIYRFVYREQEIEDIKKMLRTLQTGGDLEGINQRTLFVSRYSRIDFRVSLKSKTIKELIDSLKGTNFYAILKPLVISETKINLFAAEMALDLYYYKQLNSQISKLITGKDAQILKMIFGSDADFRNMMWIYRAKKYYNLRKEIIYSYIIPNGYKLKKNKIIELVESETAEEVLGLLKKSYYKKMIDFDCGHWGNSFYKYYGIKQRKDMRLLSFSIAPIIGYIIIKQVEIRNITTIIEGVRYKIGKDDVETYLSQITK